MTKKTILLVDADDDFRRDLTNRCEDAGLEVQQTCNLLNAAFMTAECVPDIICVDVQTSTGNGLPFCDALAADHRTSQVPIVVLTGQNDYETKHACERLQASYVAKTVDYWSTLEPIIRQLTTETMAERRAPRSGVISHGLSTGLDQHLSKIVISECSRQPNTKRILVADDDEDLVKMLSQRCSELGCTVIGVSNAFDAIDALHRITPDVVCLDVGMPSGSGLSVCDIITSDVRLRDIPIIVLTGRTDEAIRRRCHAMRVYYVEKCGNTWERVEPLLRELLHLEDSATVSTFTPSESSTSVVMGGASCEEHESPNLVDALFAILGAGTREQPEGVSGGEFPSFSHDLENIPWVLCIDDDADFSNALKIRLEDHGVAVIRAFNGREGYRLAFTSPASAILLDVNMPNGQGDYILGRLKDNPVTKDIPVLVITGTKDAMLERRMLAMGATAFFVKPLNVAQLLEHLARYVDVLGVA